MKEPEEQEDTPVAAEEKFAVTTVNIFECGHIIERGENVTATAREAEGIMQQYRTSYATAFPLSAASCSSTAATIMS